MCFHFSLIPFSDGSENVTGLDLSDFPALADRSRRDGGSNPTPLLNPLAGRAPYGTRQRVCVSGPAVMFIPVSLPPGNCFGFKHALSLLDELLRV